MTVNKELLEILACPKCTKDIRLSKDEKFIVCDNCKLLYEIKEDIPIMLIDEAKEVDDTSKY
jgi:hypothetical protein